MSDDARPASWRAREPRGEAFDTLARDELRRRLVALLGASRRANGLSQTELARRLGKPQSYVSKIERGERGMDVAEYVAFITAMGLDPLAPLQILLDPDIEPGDVDPVALARPGAVPVDD